MGSMTKIDALNMATCLWAGDVLGLEETVGGMGGEPRI